MALRFLKARRHSASISMASWIAVGGVALGVIALIVVLAVMSGLEADLRRKILGISAHLVVDEASGEPIAEHQRLESLLRSAPGVEAVSPYAVVKALVRSGDHNDGIVLRGVDPKKAAEVLAIDEQMVQGGWQDLEKDAEPVLPDERAVPGIVLGEVLASSLRVFVGERVQLLIPGAVSTPAGRQPRVRMFQVVGIFRSEIYEYDSSWAYTRLDSAQELLKMGDRISGWEAKVADLHEAVAAAAWCREALGPSLRVRDWRQLNAAFFAALQLEKWAMFIILCLIVIVAAFNIISTLSMKVMEKTKDIGVLKALGATDGTVLRVFLLEGLSIGALGTFVGLVLGTGFCTVADHYRLFRTAAEMYNMSHLPFRMEASDLVSVCVASLLISLATTFYPSYQAARLDPVEAMRGE